MSAREYAAKRLHEFANPVSSVVVDAEDVIDAIMKAMKEETTESFPVRIWPDEPQLIQGYTAEQWQEIIDGGYLCEFHTDHSSSTYFDKLKTIGIDGRYMSMNRGRCHNNCRPAQIKGVMRPIFVEPIDVTDSKNLFVFFDSVGNALHDGMAAWTYCLNPENRSRVAKYIEV